MPVTIHPARHAANVVGTTKIAKTSHDLLTRSCFDESRKCKELWQSSFDSSFKSEPLRGIEPSKNGLVFTAIKAYSTHHHLRIRPEDVWFAIISQFSFYVNAHSEELRSHFVNFEGKQNLTVDFSKGNRYTVDFADFANTMSHLIDENVSDAELRAWVMPAFSTTTDNDKVIASIMLMGITKSYFEYSCRMGCGLPSVTLLGDKADWELIRKRVDKLKAYGEEPRHFRKLLKPILSRFVKSFDHPESDDIIDFWQRIAHYKRGSSGPSYYSGWITAFCLWKPNGTPLGQIPKPRSFIRKCLTRIMSAPSCMRVAKARDSRASKQTTSLVLDGIRYHKIDSRWVPAGYTSAEVSVNDNGRNFDALIVAGSVGINITTSGYGGPKESAILDTMSPSVRKVSSMCSILKDSPVIRKRRDEALLIFSSLKTGWFMMEIGKETKASN